MASFNLSGNSWVEVIPSGGSVDKVVQVNYGQAMLVFGAPDAAATPFLSSAIDGQVTYVPAGVAVNARANSPSATVTTGDF